MRDKLLSFTERPFVRNVAAVAGGTATAQVIAILFSPLITRLYGPEAYGIQGVLMSIVAVGSSFAALSYPLAIVLPKSDRVAHGLVILSINVGLLTSAFAVVIFYVFGDTILALLNAEKAAAFVLLIPLAMLVVVLNDVLGQWLIRKRAFKLTAKVSAASSLLANSTKLGFGFVYPTAAVLVATTIFGVALRVILMFVGIRDRNTSDADKSVLTKPPAEKGRLARKYSDFAILRTPQNFINVVSVSLPVVMLAKFFGPTSVGFYALASMVLATPANLIGGSVSNVFYPTVNDAIRRGDDVRRLVVKTTVGLALIGLVPLIVIVAAGPFLFSLVFGAQWEQAGVYAQWLSVWLFFQYVNKPAVSTIPALRLQKGLLIYELFSTGSKIVALLVGFVLYESDVVGIALFSIFGVIAYLWLILWVISNAPTAKEENKTEDLQ
jgi:O-antigen/teichoic acid export membrane protein